MHLSLGWRSESGSTPCSNTAKQLGTETRNEFWRHLNFFLGVFMLPLTLKHLGLSTLNSGVNSGSYCPGRNYVAPYSKAVAFWILFPIVCPHSPVSLDVWMALGFGAVIPRHIWLSQITALAETIWLVLTPRWCVKEHHSMTTSALHMIQHRNIPARWSCTWLAQHRNNFNLTKNCLMSSSFPWEERWVFSASKGWRAWCALGVLVMALKSRHDQLTVTLVPSQPLQHSSEFFAWINKENKGSLPSQLCW